MHIREIRNLSILLKAHPLVLDAMVLSQKLSDGSEKVIALFTGVGSPSTLLLRKHIRNSAPGVQVPELFIQIEVLPLPGELNTPEVLNYVMPRTDDKCLPKSDLEKEILEIARKVLNSDAICIGDNLFDRGGTMFHVLKIAAQLERIFGVKPGYWNFRDRTLWQFAHEYQQLFRISKETIPVSR